MSDEQREPIEHETWMTDEIKCPHCGHEYTASFEYSEDISVEECEECGGKFEYERIVTIAYTTRKTT